MSESDFKKMKVAELKAELSARSIEIPRGAKKAELLAMLMSSVESQGAGDDEDQLEDSPVLDEQKPVESIESPVEVKTNEYQNESDNENQTVNTNEKSEPLDETAPEEALNVPVETTSLEEVSQTVEPSAVVADDNSSQEEVLQAVEPSAVVADDNSSQEEVSLTVEPSAVVADDNSSQEEETGSHVADGSFVEEKMEEDPQQEVIAEESSNSQEEAPNNEMVDDIVELEEPGMQDLVDESDSKGVEKEDETVKGADENDVKEGNQALVIDTAEEAMNVDKAADESSQKATGPAEGKETSSRSRTNDDVSQSRSSESSSRHSDSRKGDHHSDRKRRHEDSSRSSRRDDERFAPPPEEPEEEFDESLVVMDKYNSSLNLKLHQKRLTVTALTPESFAYLWASARATFGVTKGKVLYECKIIEEHSVRHLPHSFQHRHVVRVGWSDNKTSMLIGESEMSFGFCSTAKAVTDKTSKDFGTTFKEGDVIGCYIDFSKDETVTVHYTKNGEYQGAAFNQEKSKFEGKPMFPHITCRNVTVEFNFGQKEEAYFPHPEELTDYQFIGNVPMEERTRGLVGPATKKECNVIMLCGLPGCGKSYYANKLCEENPEKFYNVLGTKSIMTSMTVTGLPSMKREDRLSHANTCLTRIFHIACRKKRHYIIDQTNVFASARRKMRTFEGFQRKAIVIVPTDEDYKSRADKRTKDEGKDIPDYAVFDMKANFSFPEKGDLFEEVEFLELDESGADKQIAKYREEARKRGPPQEKRMRSNGGGSGSFYGNNRGMRNQWGGPGNGGNFNDFHKGGSGMGRMSGGFRGQRGSGGNGFGNGNNRYMGGGNGGRNNNNRSSSGGYGDGRRNSGNLNSNRNGSNNYGGNRNSFGSSGTNTGRGGFGGNRNGPGSNHRNNNNRQSSGSGGYGQNRQNNSSAGNRNNHNRSRSQNTTPQRNSFGQNNQNQPGPNRTNDYSQQWAQYYQQQAAMQQQQQAAAAAAAQYQNYYAYQQAFSSQQK